MRPTYARQTRVAPAPTASTALFVDAGHVRLCAARSHEKIYGSRMRPGRVSIDAGQFSRFLDSLVVDFGLDPSRRCDGRRPGRRIYDTIDADRRQRWRQLHYRSVVKAEGFIVRTVRAPHRPRKPGTIADADGNCDAVEAALAGDLVCLASGEIAMALLLAGRGGYASAVCAARELGADVVLLIPAGCDALVAQPLREAATRVIGIHPEVFAGLFEVRDSRGRGRGGRGWALAPRVGAAR